MDFSSDAHADFEGLPEGKRGICKPQMAEKTPPDCAAARFKSRPETGVGGRCLCELSCFFPKRRKAGTTRRAASFFREKRLTISVDNGIMIQLSVLYGQLCSFVMKRREKCPISCGRFPGVWWG